MAKSRAAIQTAYRARKNKKMGEAAYLQAERQRVKQYYVPTGQLPRHKQKQRREDNLLRVRLHRKRKKKESCKAYCVPLEEVQSGYWNQESVTLHPTVIYYRDTESNTLKHHSYVAVSDDRGHNTSTIKARPILDSLVPRVTKLAPDIKGIHYWTDSPTAQYRNKTIFSIVADHYTIFDGVYATWNYFESGHGKGPCDGVGGTVKRLADDAVKRGAVMQNANDFYSWAV
ncbi:hypothetical protein HOLleu_03812 [Holothuria leucospilota]|uniref:Uncharacterized protein n=1 Tax=Holothuria leucospilota TaxID=206669 RepID=A0A9Q1HM27_HOLLE|nr:hypothetical protein HOLleu_03812 [Holothuria leucospilota]